MRAQVTQYFPGGEQGASFKWKDYSPAIFNRLRNAFGIDNKDYLLSLTGDKCALPPHSAPTLRKAMH
jgi:1-phosphatidylinositol-4-phosphate 5-kinase